MQYDLLFHKFGKNTLIWEISPGLFCWGGGAAAPFSTPPPEYVHGYMIKLEIESIFQDAIAMVSWKEVDNLSNQIF